MDVKSDKVEIKDGSKISYRFHGDIKNPTVVFVSGSIFNFKQFDYVLFPRFQKHLQGEYSFLFYDYVGINGSSQIEGEFDFLEITRQHVELLDALSIEQAHHFGYSKGALISYLTAASNPNRVLSVGSYGTPNLASSDPTTQQEFSTRLQYLNSISGIWDQLVNEKNYKIVYDTVFLPTIFRGKQSSTLGPIDKIKNWWIRNKLKPLLEGTLVENLVKLYQLYKQDITEEEKERYITAMKGIEQQTILLHGIKDEIIPFHTAEELHEMVKNSQLVKFKKFSHSSPVLLKGQGNAIMKVYANFLNHL